MNANENKKLMQAIFAEMAQGNLKTFGEHLAAEVKWTISGESDWSKTYHGIEAVRNDLLKPLFEKFGSQYTNRATRIIAEDDLVVVVESKGKVNTKSGKPYNNSYCFIYRIENNKITEVTEYCDTELISTALDDKNPPLSAASQDSVMAILKLYELRRDEQMRQSRQWFLTQFAPQSALDIAALYRGGERASANFRMITSYWDMACAMVLNGAIDEKLFLDANTEHVFVYAKLQPFLADFRQLIQEPDYLSNLETLTMRTTNIEAKLESRKRLATLWTQTKTTS